MRMHDGDRSPLSDAAPGADSEAALSEQLDCLSIGHLARQAPPHPRVETQVPVVVNITVNVHGATADPPSPSKHQRDPSPPAATRSTVSPLPTLSRSNADRRVKAHSTVRGGGRVAPWDPSLEYIDPVEPPHYKKWYVVTAGRRVGIWRSWLDMEDYIDVKGRRFQSFGSCEDAEYHYYLAKQEGRVRLLLG